MAYIEEVQGVHYDELIGGTAVPVITKNVTLGAASAETEYKRGTLLALNNGKYAPADATSETTELKTASAVLAADTVAGTSDIVATVYTAGMFNREKLIAANGDTVDAHEEELRTVGIYLTSIKK